MSRSITATEIREANRAYWSPGGRGWETTVRWNAEYSKLIAKMQARVMDIVRRRVRDGWPTNDAAAPEEDG